MSAVSSPGILRLTPVTATSDGLGLCSVRGGQGICSILSKRTYQPDVISITLLKESISAF